MNNKQLMKNHEQCDDGGLSVSTLDFTMGIFHCIYSTFTYASLWLRLDGLVYCRADTI
jgi:hypothetical protein